MSLFPTFTLTVRRPTETIDTGQYIDGVWVPGTEGTVTNPDFTIQTSVQPASGKDLEVLEEGLRTKEILKIYPTTELKAVDQHNNIEADIVEYNGNDYKVINVKAYQNGIINHYKCLIMRVKE